MPTFARYFNPRLKQCRLVSRLCFNAAHRYVLQRCHWELLLYLPLESFHFPKDLRPVDPAEDIHAAFAFVPLAVPETDPWPQFADMDCREHLRNLHYNNAPPDTPVAQWAVRARLAVAYESHSAVRKLLEEFPTRCEILKRLTSITSIMGLRCHSPQNRQALCWEGNMIPWFNHDFLTPWRTRDGDEFNDRLNEFFHGECKADFLHYQQVRGIAGAAVADPSYWNLPQHPRVEEYTFGIDFSPVQVWDILCLSDLAEVIMREPKRRVLARVCGKPPEQTPRPPPPPPGSGGGAGGGTGEASTSSSSSAATTAASSAADKPAPTGGATAPAEMDVETAPAENMEIETTEAAKTDTSPPPHSTLSVSSESEEPESSGIHSSEKENDEAKEENPE